MANVGYYIWYYISFIYKVFKSYLFNFPTLLPIIEGKLKYLVWNIVFGNFGGKDSSKLNLRIIEPTHEMNNLSLDKKKTPYSILTLNANLILNRASSSKTKSLVSYLISKNYDILCFQEVFPDSIKKQMVDGLKSTYPYIIDRVGSKKLWGIGEDSGLFFASKYPIKSTQFVEFEAVSEWDKACDKGILMVNVELSNNNIVKVINTHLQSMYEYHQSMEIQKIQLVQLKEFIDQNTKTDDKLILLGDMNITDTNPHDDMYDHMMDILQLDDKLLDHQKVPKEELYTFDCEENDSAIFLIDFEHQCRLDYILSNVLFQTCYIDYFKNPDLSTYPLKYLSDHFGVVGYFY